MPLALLSALLLTLAYPPFDFGWLAWVALVPWLLSLRGAGGRQAFLRGYAAGLLFFGATMWWVGHVTITGAIPLVAALAVYFAVWSFFAARVWARRGALLALPAAWALLEFIRAFFLSGLGWNLLAHSQWHRIPLLQMADLTGPWGLSFLVVLVNVALAQAIVGWRPARAKALRAPALAAFCVVLAMAYGQLRLGQVDRALADPNARAMTVAVVQGNIPQNLKWEESAVEGIWAAYERQTLQAAARKPDLIVWPETSVPGFLEEEGIRRRLQQIAALAGVPLLVGAPTEERTGPRLFNSAVWLAPDGTELQRYNKIHLVPFGEYIPLKPVLGWLENVVPIGDFSPGSEFTLFHATLPFSVMICFEDLFPALGRGFAREGARALFVITNDGWFGRSAASVQHLQASVLRAVETRCWVVRAANTGWSGFVDPAGRRLGVPARVPRFEEGFAVGRISDGPPPGPYARFGEWFIALCAIMTCLPLLWKPSTNS